MWLHNAKNVSGLDDGVAGGGDKKQPQIAEEKKFDIGDEVKTNLGFELKCHGTDRIPLMIVDMVSNARAYY